MVKIRVFYAIEFSPEEKEYLQLIQQEVANYCVKGNPTLLENYHLTLKFIGDVEPSKIVRLKKALDDCAAKHNSFKISTNRLGQFQKNGKSIIWLGLEPNPKLSLLYETLKEVLSSYGYRDEGKSYSPHITLYREAVLKTSVNDIHKNFKIKPLEIEVSSISLMESTRQENKLTYLPLYSKLLSDKNED